MPEHDCRGWCSKPSRQDVLGLLREGKSVVEIAKATCRSKSIVATMASDARRKGCIAKVRQRGTERLVRCINPRCGKDFTAYHAGTKACSEVCSKAARRAGIYTVTRSDTRELGPAHPLIPMDEVGVRRRALDVARDGLSESEMLTRFPAFIVTWAIAKALHEGTRQKSRSLTEMLPLGLPA